MPLAPGAIPSWDWTLRDTDLTRISMGGVLLGTRGALATWVRRGSGTFDQMTAQQWARDWLSAMACGWANRLKDANARETNFIRIPPLEPVSYTHLRAHETDSYLVCRLLLE